MARKSKCNSQAKHSMSHAKPKHSRKCDSYFVSQENILPLIEKTSVYANHKKVSLHSKLSLTSSRQARRKVS